MKCIKLTFIYNVDEEDEEPSKVCKIDEEDYEY